MRPLQQVGSKSSHPPVDVSDGRGGGSHDDYDDDVKNPLCLLLMASDDDYISTQELNNVCCCGMLGTRECVYFPQGGGGKSTKNGEQPQGNLRKFRHPATHSK